MMFLKIKSFQNSLALNVLTQLNNNITESTTKRKIQRFLCENNTTERDYIVEFTLLSYFSEKALNNNNNNFTHYEGNS
jgi:5-hydroxyisourate hydrolase-like protein (transthyretin family)